MKLTRRTLVLATGSFVAAAGALSATVSPAKAESVNLADLMKPSALGDEIMGKESAPVTIVEYASMTCPHCAAFHLETLPKFKEKYIDTGKARLIFREFPLDPLAAGASMLARCAPNNNYFAMVEVLYRLQRTWATANDPVAALLQISRQTGFTQESFEACLRNQKLLDGVNGERDRASQRFGVNSTPTLIINGQVYRGALSFDELTKIVDPLLAG